MAFSNIQTHLPPPIAPRVEHVEVRHGEKVPDDFFWLRDKKNPEVLKYLKKENSYFENYKKKNFQKLSDQLYKEFFKRIVHDDKTPPSKKGSYLYWKETRKGLEEPLFFRKPIKGSRNQKLLDLNSLRKKTGYIGLSNFEVSPFSENLLLYSVDTDGGRNYVPFLKDLKTGKTEKLPMGFVNDIFWGTDENDLFWVKENESKRPFQLYRFSRKSKKSELLFEEKNHSLWYSASIGLDRKFIFHTSGSSESNEVRITYLKPGSLDFVTVLPQRSGHKYYLSNQGDRIFVMSNRKSEDFEIYETTFDALSESKWKLFIPAVKGRTIEEFYPFESFLILQARFEGITQVSLVDSTNGNLKNIVFPEPVYEVSAGPNPEYSSAAFRLHYQSLVSPRSVLEFIPKTGELETLKVQKIPGEKYNPSDYVSERIWFKARDGVRVPISLVYKKGARDSGPTPLYLYGYGSYGIPLSFHFSTNRLSLLNRGVIFAQAHVRGGGDLGEAWRKAGKFLKKKSSFYDFVDAADFLISQKWTDSSRLAMMGGSAGGLLMGAVINERPDLAKVVHLAVPFVDVMNTMWDETLPLTTQEFEEWGNPKDKQYYDYMKSYCPYTNLKKANYPSILVTSSINDSQVGFWEPAKYTAKLRTLKNDNNPLLMRMTLNSGHGGASGRYESLKEDAEEFGFILHQLGIQK